MKTSKAISTPYYTSYVQAIFLAMVASVLLFGLTLFSPAVQIAEASEANASVQLAESTVSNDSIRDGICDGINLDLAGDSDCDPEQAQNDLNEGLMRIINIFTMVAGVSAIIMMIYAGFRYVWSSGSSEGAKSALHTAFYALIGLVLVVFARGIVHYVFTRFM